MAGGNRARNWCFTLNNYTMEEVEEINDIECDYRIFGYEVGECGTEHVQGYIQFTKKLALTAVKKLIPRAHWEMQSKNSSALEAAEYCRKDGDFYEQGEISCTGDRKDLDAIKDKINNGETTVDKIVMEFPVLYHQYGRTLSKIEDIVLRKKWRTEMTKGIWYWGPTGVGKSHKALENYHPDTHYLVPQDNGWWDGYKQQETVVFNDFRGELSYNFMLNLVDKFPFSVKRRGREPLPFISKYVIVTSSLSPEKVYKNRDSEDKIEQLLRRFEVINITTRGSKVVKGNTETLTDLMDWHEAL